MVKLITNITTPNWQMNTTGFGEIAEDEQDILLCIHNIIFTQKGDVPLDPYFGSSVYRYLDGPINQIAPAIVAELYDAIGSYEPRVKVNSIKPSLNTDYSLRFDVNMTVIASGKPLLYDLTLAQNGSARAFSDEFNQKFS